MKILKREEIKDRVLYSEEYEVNYWIQKPDGFWTKESYCYFGTGKGDHEKVKDRWIKDHKNDNVKIINVIYQ